jgi:hypothetical protein
VQRSQMLDYSINISGDKHSSLLHLQRKVLQHWFQLTNSIAEFDVLNLFFFFIADVPDKYALVLSSA